MTGGDGVDRFFVGHFYRAYQDIGTLYDGYEPVTITDFDPATESLGTSVHPLWAPTGFTTHVYGDRTEIALDDADGNEHVVAILEGITGDISGANINVFYG